MINRLDFEVSPSQKALVGLGRKERSFTTAGVEEDQGGPTVRLSPKSRDD